MDHLSAAAGHTPKAVQDAVNLLCHRGASLGHVPRGVHQDHQVIYCNAASEMGLINVSLWDLSSLSMKYRIFHSDGAYARNEMFATAKTKQG